MAEKLMLHGYGKRIRNEFITQTEPNSRCGTKRKHSLREYENFVSHVRTDHPKELNKLMKDSV